MSITHSATLTLALLVLLSPERGIQNSRRLSKNICCVIMLHLCVGKSLVTSERISIKTQRSLIEARINTSISLTWQIQYESCDIGVPNCLQVIITSNRNNEELYRRIGEIEPSNNFPFNASTTVVSAGPNSYADVHIIIFVDEYVRNNVSNLTCKTVLSKDGFSSNISRVRIEVTNQTMSTTTSYNQTPTSMPPTSVCNSAFMARSSELFLELLCFYLLLYVSCS